MSASLPIITQRADTVKKAMKEVRKSNAFRQINNLLNIRNDSFIDQIHDSSINLPVLIYREGNANQSKLRKESYKLLSIQKEFIIIELLNELIMFRTTSVKSYLNLIINETETDEISSHIDS